MNKLLLIALLLLPIASNAVEWIDLGKSANKQMQTFIDLDSVKRQNLNVGSNLGRSAVKPKYISAIFQDTYINNNPLRKKGIYYTKLQWYMSCENQAYYLNAYINYGFKDEVIDSWQAKRSFLSESDFNYVFPETVGGNNIEYACTIIDMKESYDDLS